MKRISALVGVIGVLALLVAPSAALASSTCQGYSPQASSDVCSSVGNTNVSTGSGNGPGTTAAANASSTGTLPFTGLDVVLLVVGGGTLLTAGFVVRRLARRLN